MFRLNAAWVVALLAAAALVLRRAVPVAAQAELLQWVDPTLGKIMGRGDYRSSSIPTSGSKVRTPAWI